MELELRVHFAVPVWGQDYVRTFLRYCLPAQLAAGNIPSVFGRKGTYTIHTTRLDYESIASSSVFEELRRFIDVTVEFIDSDLASEANKYNMKSKCYRNALRYATKRGAALFALNADIVLANDFVLAATRLLESGKRVIEVPAPRGLLDSIGEALIAGYRCADGMSISIPPVELSALWVRFMHPQLKMHFVEGPEGEPFHPSHLYWIVGDEGVVIRGFHLYPIVIWNRDSDVVFTTTIDDDLVGNMHLKQDQICLAQDSRNMFCCELSVPAYSVAQATTRGEMSGYVDFYLSYARYNIDNLLKEIIISGVFNLGAEWDVQRHKSKQFAASLVRLLNAEISRREQGSSQKPGVGMIQCFIKNVSKFVTEALSPIIRKQERRLRDRLFSGKATLEEGLKLYQIMTERGEPFPFSWEENVLRLGIAEQPERQDLIARLRYVLSAQGKAVPQEVEQAFAEHAGRTERERDHQKDAAEYHKRCGFMDMDGAFLTIYERCRAYSMTSVERMNALYNAVNYIADADIEGAIVECGVWRGGSMMVAANTLLEKGCSDRELYLFDTYEGLPRPNDEKDVDIWGNRGIDGWLPNSVGNEKSHWAEAGLDEVRANMLSTGYPSNRLHFVKGMVEETIPGQAPDKIALLRLDTDWYESTKHELEHLFERLSLHGVLIIDDYGHFKGARKAVDDFFRTNRIPTLLNRIDYSGRLAIKIN